MTYPVRVTKKGQITLPKAVRDGIGINTPDMILIDFDDKTQALKINKVPDIMDFEGEFKAPKGMTALKARERMQDHYYDAL